MKADFTVQEDEDIEAKRIAIRKENRKAKWKAAIFKAYDLALTTEADKHVGLLSVETGATVGYRKRLSLLVCVQKNSLKYIQYIYINIILA